MCALNGQHMLERAGSEDLERFAGTLLSNIDQPVRKREEALKKYLPLGYSQFMVIAWRRLSERDIAELRIRGGLKFYNYYLKQFNADPAAVPEHLRLIAH